MKGDDAVIKTTQEDLLYLSSNFSKMLKRGFGKGPETCNVTKRGNRVYVLMRNFITPSEEVLLRNEDILLATKFRLSVFNAVAEEFVNEASRVLGTEYKTFYYDWNYDTNNGLLLLEGQELHDQQKVDGVFETETVRLLSEIGSRLHKVPGSSRIVKYTQNYCVVESKGVFLEVDHILYKRGCFDLLLHQSKEIKSGYLKHKKLFEKQFNRGIDDLFLILDHTNNRNLLIFNFNKVSL
jgi:uncharacterized protein YbcI